MKNIIGIVVIIAAVYAFITFGLPAFKKGSFTPINQGGYKGYDSSPNSVQDTAKNCASVKRVQKGSVTYQTCYNKDGKALYTQKVIE